MPKSPRYRELEIRDKIIKCLQEDDFIKTKIERINLDTKEKDYFIYKLPFTKKTINSSYALSVFFLGERTLLDNYSNISLKFSILIDSYLFFWSKPKISFMRSSNFFCCMFELIVQIYNII